MKLRIHKHLRQIRAHQHCLSIGAWSRFIDSLLVPTAEELEARRVRDAEFWASIENILSTATPRVLETEQEIQPTGIAYLNQKDQLVAVPLDSDAGRMAMSGLVTEPAQEIKYVVVFKTTGEIVGEFDLLEDAEEVIAKAKRAKKQALVLL